MTAKDPVFLKCAPQTDGSAIIDADTPIVHTLPSTEDGKIYIYLGIVDGETTITLYYWHPIYYYKDGAIRVWTNAATGQSITIDTIPTSGSSNAVSSGGVYSALLNKANDGNVVHISGEETVLGLKVFTAGMKVDDSNEAPAVGISDITLQPSTTSIIANKYYDTEKAEDFSWIAWNGTYMQ